ncbi:MAG TPA: fumarylacetoacetate hydrolase family protein, partial [Pseudonocardiaceae bacterium]|nr:fumarylacetoacetate hydrolase family protein [Pseudonocardiaceae bacterium]
MELERAGPGEVTVSERAPASWTELSPGHPFNLHALPYGVFTGETAPQPHIGVAAGDAVLDLTLASAALLPGHAALFGCGTLDRFLAAGPRIWSVIRATVMGWLTDERLAGVLAPLLVPVTRVVMCLPFTVADYVDFYSCEQHAANVGRILRPGQPALPANWRHLPAGYHGRAGTVVVSGTPVTRPDGQWRLPDGTVTFGPSTALDFEAEVGFVVGVPSRPGDPLSTEDFADHVFGVVLVND